MDDVHAREDNARLRVVLGHCPTAIAVLDERGNLVGYNREFVSILSTPPPLGEPVAQLFEAGPRAMLAEVVARAGTEQRAGAMVSMRTTVGEEHDFELLVATLPGAGARTIGVVLAAYDRTDRIQKEAETSLLTRDIGAANCQRAINLGQSALCHDISNVLTTIALSLESLAQRCGEADVHVRALLHEIDEAVKHGGEIVARAKRSSRAAAARSESTDVRECVARAMQIVGPLARKAKVALASTVLCDVRVPLGGTELTQVLTNVLTNSVHAIEDAQRPGRVGVRVERATGETVTVCVRDDGVGIEPARLVDSFEAFETTRASRGGTGLGLAIAREIIEGGGGHIDVLSTPGSATEIHLVLPIAPRAEAATPPA